MVQNASIFLKISLFGTKWNHKYLMIEYLNFMVMSAKYFTEIILQNKNFLRKTRHRRARLTRLCSVFLRSLSALAACLDVIDNKISRRLALYWLKLTTLDMVEELTTPGTVKFILA